MIGSALDRLIAVFAPGLGLKRTQTRATLDQINALSGGKGGYDAAKLNRLTKGRRGSSQTENDIPRGQMAVLRNQAWDLYRNNPTARKIVRTLEAKVIGRGLTPNSQAKKSGEAFTKFRDRARELWEAMDGRIDWRGRPGNGGQCFVDLSKAALRGTMLGGEVLTRFRVANPEKTKLPPLRLQHIHACRLDESLDGDNIFSGIELDKEARRVAYHILDHHPADKSATIKSRKIKAADIVHLFKQEDIDQIRGTPWFAAAMLTMRDTGDYEHTEMVAANMAACVVMGYRLAPGQEQFGPTPSNTNDLTDADGNTITHMQPGMMVNMGAGGELQGFDPGRPNAAIGEFIGHMMRKQAAAVPGVKGSTLTMDYRRSSFASEKSADNDIWPEIEDLQDWFAQNFCQPIYERLVTEAVASGWFDGVVTAEEFSANREQLLKTRWQGPVARSINPTDDAEAAMTRVRNGTSTPQREAALLGRNWQELLIETKEYIDFATVLEIPQDVISQHLGIEQEDEAKDEADPDAPDEPDDDTPPKADRKARREIREIHSKVNRLQRGMGDLQVLAATND